MIDLQQCLPPSLRGPTTAITRIASGFSGAAVHRVDAGDRAFVLKLARADESLDDWRRNLATRRAPTACWRRGGDRTRSARAVP